MKLQRFSSCPVGEAGTAGSAAAAAVAVAVAPTRPSTREKDAVRP
jgi:hypothetical protein